MVVVVVMLTRLFRDKVRHSTRRAPAYFHKQHEVGRCLFPCCGSTSLVFGTNALQTVPAAAQALVKIHTTTLLTP